MVSEKERGMRTEKTSHGETRDCTSKGPFQWYAQRYCMEELDTKSETDGMRLPKSLTSSLDSWVVRSRLETVAHKKTQREAVIKTMEENDGYATLQHLYENAMRIPGVRWETKTPYASMRRIVQKSGDFFKIQPGLWALKSYRRRLPPQVLALVVKAGERAPDGKNVSHYYYQGIAVELGNLRSFRTYVPAQDKNRPFLCQKLGDVATTTQFPPFTYSSITKRVRSIDVVWFNRRMLPNSVFEIEYTTDFKSSLMKFAQLVDFNTEMIIVAAKPREPQYRDALGWSVFAKIRNRVRFLSFDSLAAVHARMSELRAAEENVLSGRTSTNLGLYNSKRGTNT